MSAVILNRLGPMPRPDPKLALLLARARGKTIKTVLAVCLNFPAHKSGKVKAWNLSSRLTRGFINPMMCPECKNWTDSLHDFVTEIGIER